MKKELLAPAGDLEAGYAALYYGADAVYLGLKQFSARASAQNFDEAELNEFVGYAHFLKKKVFVTINTLLQQGEIADLIKNLDICRRANVDALIVQDLGVARVVKKYYPEMELHASTQMAIHNKEGALALKKLGFSRVVLARELTLPEIKEIANAVDVELEVFVHGALCYSYSGICQFSSMMSGRSANRGKCQYPCRAEFMRDGRIEHCFSMKDLALEEDVLKLPVYSLKIEGRKKSALYVAAVVDYYRNILDGNGAIKEKAQDIKQIFSRPWCKFHLGGKDKDVVDKKFVGHRGLAIGKIEEIKNNGIVVTINHKIAKHDGIQIDVEGMEKPYGFSLQKFKVGLRQRLEAQAGEKVEIVLPQKPEGLKKGAGVYLASSSEVKGKYSYQKPKPREFLQRVAVDVEVWVQKDKIKAISCGKETEIKASFEKALDVGKTNEAIKKAFAKTGDTEFELRNLLINNEEKCFVPVSLLNDLRRSLYGQIVPEQKIVLTDEIEPRNYSLKAKWAVKTDDVGCLGLLDKENIDEFIILIDPDFDLDNIRKLPKDKVRIALPVVCRNAKDLDALIGKLLNMGYKKWEIANYWGLSVLPVGNLDVSFDNLIYMFNTEAMQMAKEIGASRVTLAVEDTLSNLKNLAMEAPLPVEMVVYQDVPLFTSAVCIRQNSCRDCDRKDLWMDLQKDGVGYKVLSKNCETKVFSALPFAAAEQVKEIRADFYRADFCHKKYGPEQVRDIIKSLMNFKNPDACMSGNILRRNEMF